MKKIFMLLIAAGTFTIASAQSGRFDHGKQDNGYAYNNRPSAIQDINRSYDFKIADIKHNRWMNRWEKERQINQLERQRDAEISRLQFRFQKDNHSYGDHGYSDNRNHKW